MEPWKFSIVFLAGSVSLTVFLWMFGLPLFFLFFFVPLIPFFSSRSRVRRCPACGWKTSGNELFCPYDAYALEDDERHYT